MAPHSSTLAWKIPWMEGAWWAAVHGVAKSRTRLSDFTFTFPFHALEKEMATHSSVLAWRIAGTGEPGGLPSMGSQSWTRLKRLSSKSVIPKFTVQAVGQAQLTHRILNKINPSTHTHTCTTKNKERKNSNYIISPYLSLGLLTLKKKKQKKHNLFQCSFTWKCLFFKTPVFSTSLGIQIKFTNLKNKVP